jgi:hypothetical protein
MRNMRKSEKTLENIDMTNQKVNYTIKNNVEIKNRKMKQ